MIARLIRWSIANRLLVLLAAAFLAAWGIWAVRQTPVDALPDLSDVQVIVRTTWPGQAPQLVEDQVTYPLSTTMLSVPGAKTVRGYSFFGESYVYVLFEDGTDLYWARSRVLEYLGQVQSRLPAKAQTSLGPDATGVGWIYEYALVDPSGKHDLSELRTLQDWFLRFELKSVPGVAEVASVGGMLISLFVSSAYPDFAYWTVSGEAVFMIMLGGINVFFGPLVGASLLLMLNDMVTKVTEHFSLVLGVIILIFALGLRKGLLGFVVQAWRKYAPAASVKRA